MVFVDHAAEDASPLHVLVDVDGKLWVVVGRALVEALVWTVPIEVVFILTQQARAWCSL